jgi:ABC-type Fe3+ transport system substrate-binding protein
MLKSTSWVTSVAVAAVAFLAIGGAAHGQSFDHDAYIAKLAAAAKAKGQTEITMYSNNTRDFGEIFETFKAKFGITVKPTDMFGPPLVARLEAEFAANGHSADIISSGVSDLIVFHRKGWLASWVPESARLADKALIGPNNEWFGFAVLPLGTIVNSQKIKAEDCPDTWAKHVDGRWAGKIAMNNPSASSGLSQGVASSLEHKGFDVEWITKLAALKPLIMPSSNASVQMAASGQAEYAPYVSFNTYKRAVAAGAPLAFCLQKDGYAALPAPASLGKGAVREEAAKLLLAWYLTPEAQALFSKSGQQAIMPGAPGLADLPEASQYPRHVMTWQYLDSEYGKMLEANKGRFGQ